MRPGEDKVGLNDVPNKGKHGNTAVLDLRLAKPSNCGFISLSPKVLIGKVHRVIELELGVALGSNGLKVSLGGRQVSLAGGTARGGGKRGRASHER